LSNMLGDMLFDMGSKKTNINMTVAKNDDGSLSKSLHLKADL